MDILVLTDKGTNNAVFRDAYRIRLRVFSEEQGIPEDNEIDDLDNTAYHCVIYTDGIPTACGRMNIVDGWGKICRIAVMKDYRRRGFATDLCKRLIAMAQQSKAEYVYLHAQAYITELYAKIGFVPEGDIFLEEGIPHVRMTKRILPL